MHIFFHMEKLVSKTTQDELRKALNQVIGMANFVKTQVMKSRLFSCYARIWILNMFVYYCIQN